LIPVLPIGKPIGSEEPIILLEGRNMKPIEDLTGKIFGDLTVIGPIFNNGRRWLCRCSCGNEVYLRANRLTSTNTKSCGCNKGWPKTSNGLSASPEYKAYCDARSRCLNPNRPNYSGYGGRGIKFLLTSFNEMFKDIGPRPSSKHSLDRIDNDGNYEVGNLRWATKKEQQNNMRSNCK
jgi:hypothetical protein